MWFLGFERGKDVLTMRWQTIRNFKPMANAIEAVYMVETSPSLREKQRQLLCGDNPMTETDIGFKSTSKYANIPVIWTENIRFVPSSTTARLSFDHQILTCCSSR